MTRHPMPPARISAGPTAQRFRTAPLTLVAAAVAIALGSLSGEAGALSLGRINVLSALGEPLRAEVDITEITAAEAEGLRVNVASSEAFRVAGIPYNTALSDVRASLQRRADGRYMVRLTSTRGLTDPFVDLLLEANSSTSRVVRDYTLLLDPPSGRPTPAAAAAASPAVTSSVATPTVRAAQRPVEVAPVPAPTPAPARVQATAPAPSPARSVAPQQVTVRAGDTASRIANSYKPAEVSLDQMLVAMLRTNPDAFISGNMNRIKAGALIDLPDAAQAGATTAPEAKRMVVAQSRDFGDYRRRLADNAPASRVAESGRQAGGKLQASVEDRSIPAASPDKLTVAQGRLADQQIAQARQAQESNARMAELSKNIGELNRLQAAGGAAGAAAGTAVAASPAPVQASPTPQPSPMTSASSGSETTATAAAPAVTPIASVVPVAPIASATPAASPVTPSAAPTAAPGETAWYVDLLNNPIVLGALSLIVLLLGWIAYRLAGKRRQDAGDSVFMESRLPKDSFFAGSGGETVDTKNRGNSIISSLSYSPSQMDSGDVDPVAEADVYLAYGRDLQAEEILREALRVNPERAAIHLKLLEIHAKRRDLRAYEALAADVQKLTGGTGNEWNRVVEMGKELDPGNPLYEAGMRSPTFAPESAASVAANVSAAAAAAGATGFSHTLGAPLSPPPPSPPVTYTAPPPAFVPSVAPLDFDLDLDRPDAQAALDTEWITASLPTRPAPLPKVAPAPAPPSIPDAVPINLPLIDLENDFNTEPGALEMPAARPAAPEEAKAPKEAENNDEAVTVRGDLKGDSGFIEFDMSAFTGLRTAEHTDTEAGGLDDYGGRSGSETPHAIKLSLARELQALGDTEGARSLMEEVEAESSGDLKVQAKQLLASL
ncbi:FimV/HubP family polar landmark protein [Variovorax sp. RHLX14]|uniref:FimV/HubP family polar landmark protein n=1 Tax=Variovorax sp. RHLX14 TaxID=1259731 RepID=UPI003F45C7B6